VVERLTEPVLTAALAQEIAGETSRIIGFNVLITDRAAVVIGSGDQSRLGTAHEASVAVLRTGQPSWHTAEQAARLTGVRPGITLPIVLDGDAIGTVGITGAPRRVRQFGQVVQRQTEILVRESLLLRSRLWRERALADLFRDIALFDADIADAAAITQRAVELDLDPTLSRVVLLVDVADRAGVPTSPPDPDSLGLRATPARTVREVFGHAQDVAVELAAGRVGVLHRDPGDPGDLADRCQRVIALLDSRHGAAARIGVGGPADTLAGLRESYVDADAALRLGPAFADSGRVYEIAALRTHQLLASAGQHARARFLAVTVAGLRTEPDWPALRDTIIAWAQSGFNLVRAAARLHIHRNTLLYRLDKITDRAGRPIRDPAHGLALYLACLADQLPGN
jgi:carbohydrate diacid regulator